MLKEMCIGRDVTVFQTGIDRYGRPIAFIYVMGQNVNAAMVREGLAWHYKKYSDDDELAEVENEAREAKQGLWADAEPVAPWTWRKQREQK